MRKITTTRLTSPLAGKLTALLVAAPILAGCPKSPIESPINELDLDFAEYAMEVRINGMGVVFPDQEPLRTEGGIAYYVEGTELQLRAEPDDGFRFVDWDATDCTDNRDQREIIVLMDEDHLCVANFAPTSSGIPPVARIVVSPSTQVDPNTMVTLDGSTSSDADGQIVSWDWDFDSDGTIDASGEVVTTSFSTPGISDVFLTVTDNDALTGLAATGIRVNDPNPAPEFTVLVNVSGPGQVDVDSLSRSLPDNACDGEECFLFGVPSGSSITLVAVPTLPAAFLGWVAGECDETPSAEECVINVTSDRSVQASFQ